MRVHRHLVDAIAVILAEIFEKEAYADKVLDRHLKENKKWGARDRRFVAEAVYEMVRWWRYLWWLKGDNQPTLQNTALKELWAIWWTQLKKEELPPWWDLALLTNHRSSANEASRAIKESVPEWMDQLGERELSDRWPLILNELNQPAQVYLRTNTLKTDASKLQRLLADLDIRTELLSADLPWALKLSERKNVFVTKLFKDGLFEVQDAASQLVAPLLEVEPGMRVVDACAGAGGKSLHLASLMNNTGKILALDIHDWKLGELRRRAKRAGAQNIETRAIESSKVIKRLKDSCDRLLLDVPCSGLGVLKRNPDTKWKLKAEDVDNLIRLQKDILNRYSQMVKPGGKMVYATCSILPSEDEKQVEGFVSETPGWEVEELKRLDPDQTGFDGFFAARLVRRD